MSSAVVSTPAALGRPFVFDDEAAPYAGCPVERSSTAHRDHLLQSTITNKKIPAAVITPASQLQIRPAPEKVSSGIPAIDALTGGLPRGCLTEICGPASSGRTTLLLAALAAATHRGEFCAVVDASDALDPHSAIAAGVEPNRLLWVRCGENPPQNSPQKSQTEKLSQAAFKFASTESQRSDRCLEQVLRATDLLLESGGYSMIVLDLAGLPHQSARRIPLTTWFRFRRAIEHTPTILLAIESQPIAGSCSSLLLQLGSATDAMWRESEIAAEQRKSAAHGESRGLAGAHEQTPEGRKKNCAGEQPALNFQFTNPTHAQLLTGLNISAELIRSRLDRKPARSITFATKTAWAG
jgi:hypothetical protein